MHKRPRKSERSQTPTAACSPLITKQSDCLHALTVTELLAQEEVGRLRLRAERFLGLQMYCVCRGALHCQGELWESFQASPTDADELVSELVSAHPSLSASPFLLKVVKQELNWRDPWIRFQQIFTRVLQLVGLCTAGAMWRAQQPKWPWGNDDLCGMVVDGGWDYDAFLLTGS